MSEEVWEAIQRLERRQYYQEKRIKELEQQVLKLALALVQHSDGDDAERAFITAEECQPVPVMRLSREGGA